MSKFQKEPSGIPPDKFPDVPPTQLHSSGDFSYTLEVVMGMQKTLGQLCEAVTSLKEQSKAHEQTLGAIRDNLHDVVKEIHGAKVAGKALLWVIGLVGALVGICLGAYFQAKLSSPQIPYPQTQNPTPRNP